MQPTILSALYSTTVEICHSKKAILNLFTVLILMLTGLAERYGLFSQTITLAIIAAMGASNVGYSISQSKVDVAKEMVNGQKNNEEVIPQGEI